MTPTEPPKVTTNDASTITDSSATLNGNLDDLGTASTVNVSFEWGLDTSYGNETTPQAITTTGPFSFNLSDLSPNTTYHFRAKAVGEGTSYGLDKSFTTAEVIPGDANADGVINVLDITKVARVIVGLDAETPGADANEDGVVNVLDITKIARIIVGLD